jgi:virulence factor Mce-like protein
VKRLALIALVLVAGAAFLVTGAASGDDNEQRYWVEMDNAFGLIEGADVKVAGVRAGKIKTMEVDPRTYRARVEIDITERGFGSLRSDVFCESRPQSLIGEYFIDCLPGKAPTKIKSGSTIPVHQTASTVPVDLVNNIMRRPYRERFSILIGELGAAFGARGDDLNETIRRVSPALRETDKVLAILAQQRHIIRNLTGDADVVLSRLSDNRKDVTRFISEARDTSKATAAEADSLAGQFRRLPTFLRELRPTLAELDNAAQGQIGALSALNANAGRLRRFFDALGPFSEASRPATRSLAGAARAGRPFVRAARPRISELRRVATPLPELSRNLAFTLEDLDSRGKATEKDTRAPGNGYTGLEAILQYVFNQSQAINLFDNESYILKVSAFLDSTCANYTDAAQAKADRSRDRCLAALGPRRPGINEPDPSATPRARADAQRNAETAKILDGAGRAADGAPAAGAPGAPGPAARPTPGGLGEALGGLLGGRLPDLPLPGNLTQSLPREPLGGQSAAPTLLDYLLGA